MGRPSLGAGLPTWEQSEGRGGGVAVPSGGDGDWTNWKGLELPGEEKEGDYLQVGGPWGRGSQEAGGDGGYRSPGPGPGVQTH